MLELSKEAVEVLHELIEHEGDLKYWEKRFDELSYRDDRIMRGCFSELRSKGMISAQWADNAPYLVDVLKDGYLYDRHLQEAQEEARKPTTSKFEKVLNTYDVFLSHANSDKLTFVDELNESLKKLRVKIFYDKESLEWGDNWKQRILDGTKQAEFAIIVISENFFNREWTERELNEFLNRQNQNGQKLILPILHGISAEQLRKKYPTVADIQAIDSQKYSCDQIALLFAGQLIKRLKSM